MANEIESHERSLKDAIKESLTSGQTLYGIALASDVPYSELFAYATGKRHIKPAVAAKLVKYFGLTPF